MAMSDEEGEILPDFITNYYFTDCDNSEVSFAVLPVLWKDEEEDDELLQGSSSELQVYMQGRYDGGVQEVCKRAIAWKFELSDENPSIYMLSKDMNWIALQKPKKSYEPFISSIVVTVHWLNFSHKNGDNDAWNRFVDSFSSLEVVPTKKHLLDHAPLIREAKRSHKDLANSKSSILFIKSPPSSTNVNKVCVKEVVQEEFQADKSSDYEDNASDVQGVEEGEDDEEEDDDDNDEEEEEDDNYFDTVCAICDDGGNLLCCNGVCMRSFHPTPEDGERTGCISLGFTRKEEVEAMQDFMCKNCLHQQHQCSGCGRLGSSVKSNNQEVYQCATASCGHFYHADCVTRLLYPRDKTTAADLRWRISAGESFICPAHKCSNCKKVEDMSSYETKFAICRRCPKAYHRQCLPSGIKFYSDGINVARAWEGLLHHGRDLIYCMDHAIDSRLGTPARDHLVFPGQAPRQKAKQVQELVAADRVKVAAPEGGSMNLEKLAIDTSSAKKSPFIIKIDTSTNRIEKRCLEKPPQPQPQQQQHFGSTANKAMRTEGGKVKMLHNIPPPGNKKLSFGSGFTMSSVTKPATTSGSSAFISSSSSGATTKTSTFILPPRCPARPPQPPVQKGPVPSESYLKSLTDLPTIDEAQFKRRLAKLREDSEEKFEQDKEEILERARKDGHDGRATTFVKSITVGRVENYVQAVRLAKEKLENGGSIDDALAVCPRETLTTLYKWRSRITGYIQPFIHGPRYTSFGRHFTKLEKLQEIVNRLHFYVRDGDMIVDFCCGSNDFSLLMKEKLESTGKSCLFKNFDLIQTKNDFCFEKRNWMHVKPSELPDGSRLIMGLNPPFGHKASLANAFIRQALKFRPKLLILIVPKETKRVDAVGPYNLIWEDPSLLAGKAFYLPGSVDINNKQLEDWNKSAPPLSLWSRSDFTATHLKIARQIANCGGGGDEIGVEDFAMKEEENQNQSKGLLQHQQLNLGSYALHATLPPAADADAAAADAFPEGNSDKSSSGQTGESPDEDVEDAAEGEDDDDDDDEEDTDMDVAGPPTQSADCPTDQGYTYPDLPPPPPPPPLRLPPPPPIIYGNNVHSPPAFSYFPGRPMGSWPQPLDRFPPTFPVAHQPYPYPELPPHIRMPQPQPPPPGFFTFRSGRN